MLDKFNHFIAHQELVHKSQKVLIAMSGGIDSMCLVELFRRSGYDIGIAHLNHGMRSDASDGDELFCKEYARKHQIECFTKKINLKKIKSNFQAEARKIRYQWFYDLAEDFDYDLIATAHHKDDDVENFFIRINRNSGLQGLSGIAPKTGMLIRPLLYASKEDILQFVHQEEIDYREDASNHESKYRRNFFRNKILPKIEKKIPGYKYNVISTIQKIREANNLLKHLIHSIEEEITFRENDHVFISMNGLIAFPSPKLILFYILNQYGLNRTQSDNLFDAKTGSVIQSQNLIFLKNRSEIIIKEREQVPILSIDIVLFETDYPIGQMNVLRLSRVDSISGEHSTSEIYIDEAKVQFPLKVRSRQEGDLFYPIGMEMKSKKLKKFLIDEKLNQFEKESIRILADANDEIIWIIGYRADERFAARKETKQPIKVSINKHSE